MSVHAPAATAAGARPDVVLPDATAFDKRFGKHPAIAIVAVDLEGDLTSLHQCLQPSLRRAAARLVQLGRVHIGEAELLAIAHQRVAVDGEAALRRGAACRGGERDRADQLPNLMYFTISFCTSGGCSSRPWNIFSTSSGPM